MYRVSSKGNPYHDAKGRFARKDGMEPDEQKAEDMGLLIKDKKTGEVVEDKRTTMWSSFGEQVDLKKKDVNQASKLDKKKTKEHLEDGQRFYHKQSITRDKKARQVSTIKPPAKTPRKESEKLYKKSYADFKKENAAAIRNGGHIVVLCEGNHRKFQIVESARMAKETASKKDTVSRNTSTSMKLFYGYTVEFYKDNEVKSCKQDATLSEAQEHLSKFCQKHKKTMSNPNVILKVWRDDSGEKGRLRYMPTFFFENESDAKAFAAEHKSAVIVNHDDGSQA